MCRRRRVGAERWRQGHSRRPRVRGGPALGPSTSALTWPSEGPGNGQGREELIFPKRWARAPLGAWRPGWGGWGDPLGGLRPQLGSLQPPPPPCLSPQGAHPRTHVARRRPLEPPALMAKAGVSAGPGPGRPWEGWCSLLRGKSYPSTVQRPGRCRGRGGRCWDLAPPTSYFQKENRRPWQPMPLTGSTK